MPEGFRLVECAPLDRSAPALNRSIRGIDYRVDLPDGAPDAAEKIAAFAALSEASVVREREGKQPVRINLKAAVDGLSADGPNALRFTLRAGATEAVARPSELLTALFGAEFVQPGIARLVRESVIFGPPAT